MELSRTINSDKRYILLIQVRWASFLFMRRYGMSIHQAAAYTIGLVGMGLYDKLALALLLPLSGCVSIV